MMPFSHLKTFIVLYVEKYCIACRECCTGSFLLPRTVLCNKSRLLQLTSSCFFFSSFLRLRILLMWRYLILTSNEVAAGCQTLVHVASVLEGVDGEDQPHQYHEQADNGEGGHCPLVVCEMKDGELRKLTIIVHEKNADC